MFAGHADAQGVKTEPGKSQRGWNRDQRKERAFNQRLARDAAARRAKRDSHARFMPTLRRTGEQEVGNVRARDKEHDEGRRLP